MSLLEIVFPPLPRVFPSPPGGPPSISEEPMERFRWNFVCIILGCIWMGYSQKFWPFSLPPAPQRGCLKRNIAHHLLSNIFWKKVFRNLWYMGLSFGGGEPPPSKQKVELILIIPSYIGQVLDCCWFGNTDLDGHKVNAHDIL